MNSNCVLITGSSDGLGKAMALRFASQGWDVVVHGRDKAKIVAVEREAIYLGSRVHCVEGDVTRMNTIFNLVKVARTANVNLLINNAGVYLNSEISGLDHEQIAKVMDTNLMAPIFLTRNIFEFFKERGSGGAIININSLAGKTASPNEAVYCASKHGLRGFMSSFKHEALRHNVTVLDVYFGAVNTKMADGRKDVDKFISKGEAAELVFSLANDYKTLRVSEIEILRKVY